MDASSESFQTTHGLLLKPLNRFEKCAEELFRSLSVPNSSRPAGPSPDDLLAADAELAAALQQVRRHEVNQRRVEQLKDEVLDLDSKLRHVWSTLEESRKELEDVLEEGDLRLKEMDSVAKGAVPYSALLAYASLISPFTSAPPTSYGPIPSDQPAPPWIKPPFPNEEKMRAGRLAERPALDRVSDPAEPEIRPMSVDPYNVGGAAYGQDYNQEYSAQQAQSQDVDVFDLDLNPDL